MDINKYSKAIEEQRRKVANQLKTVNHLAKLGKRIFGEKVVYSSIEAEYSFYAKNLTPDKNGKNLAYMLERPIEILFPSKLGSVTKDGLSFNRIEVMPWQKDKIIAIFEKAKEWIEEQQYLESPGYCRAAQELAANMQSHNYATIIVEEAIETIPEFRKPKAPRYVQPEKKVLSRAEKHYRPVDIIKMGVPIDGELYYEPWMLEKLEAHYNRFNNSCDKSFTFSLKALSNDNGSRSGLQNALENLIVNIKGTQYTGAWLLENTIGWATPKYSSLKTWKDVVFVIKRELEKPYSHVTIISKTTNQ